MKCIPFFSLFCRPLLKLKSRTLAASACRLPPSHLLRVSWRLQSNLFVHDLGEAADGEVTVELNGPVCSDKCDTCKSECWRGGGGERDGPIGGYSGRRITYRLIFNSLFYIITPDDIPCSPESHTCTNTDLSYQRRVTFCFITQLSSINNDAFVIKLTFKQEFECAFTSRRSLGIILDVKKKRNA